MAIKSRKLEFIIFCLTTILIALLSYLLFIKSPLINQTITLIISQESRTKEVADNRPIIAIILTDFGTSKSIKRLSKDLPTEINFGISPYNLSQTESLKIENNILFNIPLAPISNDDDPPLDPFAEENTNLNRLNKFLFSAKKYQGVYTEEDEIFTENMAEAEFFLTKLQRENMLYLSESQNRNANIYEVAEKIGFHILTNNVNLDEVLSRHAINNKLKELENIAKKQGFAIAKGSNYSLTIKSLKEWLPSLASKNIRLVSIEDFYKITYYTYFDKSVYDRELSDNIK